MESLTQNAGRALPPAPLSRPFATFRATLVVLGLLVASCSGGPAPHAQTATPRASDVAKTSAARPVDFSLIDARSLRPVAMSDFRDKSAVVIAFVGTECPISKLYTGRLVELSNAYAARGVQFVIVDANVQDKIPEIAVMAQQFKVPFPVLRDEGNVLADALGAERTVEAFVLDGDRTVRYRGRIDDQWDVVNRRLVPRQRDLVDALDAVLAKRPVAREHVEPSGCQISKVAKGAKVASNLTYAHDVARIIQDHCVECHRPHQIAPMSLLTYEDVSSWGGTIREAVMDRRMPPWELSGADPKYGHFSNDGALPAKDKETLLAWLDGGMAEGDPKDLPAPKNYESDWHIGKPDLILPMAKAFAIPAKPGPEGIPYQYVPIEYVAKEDLWVERTEVRPGNPSVVHHAAVKIHYPGQDDGIGRRFATFTPGRPAAMYPPGTAQKIPKGSHFVFELHYTSNGLEGQTDLSQVGFVFAKKPPARQVQLVGLGLLDEIVIPPNSPNVALEKTWVAEEDARILDFTPHAHVRGKDFFYEAIYPDGRRETLLSVPHYDFNWQHTYMAEKQIAIPKGTRIHVIAHYDNSDKNPNNPDPNKEVRFGGQSWDEMMFGYLNIVYELSPSSARMKQIDLPYRGPFL